MKPPHREIPPEPVVERVGEDGVVYVERADRGGNWEDRQRPRSFPQSLELLIGAICLLIVWLATLTALGSLILIFLGFSDPWTTVSIWALGVMVPSMAVALGISTTKKCPLCHCTPLHSRHCHKHRLANHWPPLTIRATTVIRILTTLSFRCMYCGTPFRLFKKSSRSR